MGPLLLDIDTAEFMKWKKVMETIKKRFRLGLLDIDKTIVVGGPTASLHPKVCLVLCTRPIFY